MWRELLTININIMHDIVTGAEAPKTSNLDESLSLFL